MRLIDPPAFSCDPNIPVMSPPKLPRIAEGRVMPVARVAPAILCRSGEIVPHIVRLGLKSSEGIVDARA
jgi:hypothetical protein